MKHLDPEWLMFCVITIFIYAVLYDIGYHSPFVATVTITAVSLIVSRMVWLIIGMAGEVME